LEAKFADKTTPGQKFADQVAKTIRSWTFVIIQAIFIATWIFINHNNPSIAWDNKSFDILRLVIAIESSFIGSLLLMSQHNTALKDRKVIHNDYYVDLKIWQDVREMRPMIEKMYKELNKKDGLG
jgi:uncharacterized membrane protein